MLDFFLHKEQEVAILKKSFQMLDSSVHLNGACNVETLLHAGDVELDHSQVFAFDYDASHRADKSEREVRGSCQNWKHKLTMLTVVKLIYDTSLQACL